jgi:hypothetical protein
MEKTIEKMISSELKGGKVGVIEALASLCKDGGEFMITVHKDEVNYEIEWYTEDIEEPSKEEIDAEIVRLQDEYDGNQYQRDRTEGIGSIYPTTGEQFDLLYHELETSGSLTTSGSWFKAVKAVKDANPKPE